MSEKVVFVTGGSRGIGRAAALRLKDDGWRVAIHYGTNHAAAEEVKQALGDAWAGSYACDLNDPAAARAMMQQVLTDLPVKALVNNAGIYTKVSFLEADAATLQDVYETTMRVNFYSPLAMIHEAVARFAKQGGGRIVNVASRVGHRGEANASAYSVSKAALLNLTRALAVEHAKLNIRHMAIAPGWVETAMAREGMETRLPQILADIPLGRMASPEDCAAAIAFLLRDETEYMSGIVIDINGASYLR
ncbi:MAG: SDR family NAD(P)-dependent oxidoreductase [Fimbriimonadaceae bacterium]